MKHRKIIHQQATIGPNLAAVLLMASLLALWVGCPSNHSAEVSSSVTKRITEILVGQDDESWYCAIRGNGPLTFTAANQIDPTGLLLYFPDTDLVADHTIFIPPDNEIFKSIEVDEAIDGNIKNARLLIVMKLERPYSFSPDQNGFRISFPKTTHRREDTDAAMNAAPDGDATGPAEKEPASATVLETVTATALKNHMIVSVNADGSIGDYQSFTIENPARIVFDLQGLKSPYEKEQIIAVASRWVKQIRYFAYPDKIRLVLDTEPEFLSQYFSFPTVSGLLIYIGRRPQPLAN